MVLPRVKGCGLAYCFNIGYLYAVITTIGTDISRAAELLIQGQLVAIPTETVYGLAGNATDGEAVARIFEAKQRPRFNPLIMHLPNLDAAAPYVTEIPEALRKIADVFSPGPVSYLLPRTNMVPDIITHGSDKVVIRVPAHPMALQLLRALPFPLAAPSANPFGYVSPVTAQHVYDGLHGKIPYILDGGTCTVGVESTIIGMEEEELVIYRVGGLSAEEIEHVTGMRARYSLLHKQPATPGQLRSHYAPHKSVIIGDPAQLIYDYAGKKIAVISFTHAYANAYLNRTLSVKGDLAEAAANLFSVLRELDQSEADLIIAEMFPQEGLGIAINDRLSRASA
jgi:L-threonylcarbamoyladenylate synthase